MNDSALYVYALLPDVPGDPADGVTGLDDRTLRVVRAPGTGLAALVHDGPAEPFEGGDETVRRWVVEQDRAVVAVWERTGAVLPMTFNVLVAPGAEAGAEERLCAWLGERAEELSGRLRELDGRAELRVELTVDREAATGDDERARALEAEMADRSPGMRRLLAKKLEGLRKEASERLADSIHADVRRRLAAVVEDIRDRTRSVRDPREAEVMSAALLVPATEIETVGTVLADVQDSHPAVRVRFLGPWPPYSFTELPAGPGAAEDMTPAG
ncbi:GvpL/GvpF family gas vesicle protein [Streptomyces sp. NPDC002734]|uniref:GvpL/GvpF family gas vesicle protein n=1 Tax=Streptomyces sp. NPDC002734 TaxID=3154426 RepID=UPI0033276B3F